MSDIKDIAMRFILKWEGGFIDNPADPGGATNFGISLRFLRGRGMDIDGNGDIDKFDVLGLSKEKAIELYFEHFWKEYGDAAISLSMFDTSINCGPYAASKIYLESGNNIERFILRRIGHYLKLIEKNRDLKRFLGGWCNRCLALYDEVAKL